MIINILDSLEDPAASDVRKYFLHFMFWHVNTMFKSLSPMRVTFFGVASNIPWTKSLSFSPLPTPWIMMFLDLKSFFVCWWHPLPPCCWPFGVGGACKIVPFLHLIVLASCCLFDTFWKGWICFSFNAVFNFLHLSTYLHLS